MAENTHLLLFCGCLLISAHSGPGRNPDQRRPARRHAKMKIEIWHLNILFDEILKYAYYSILNSTINSSINGVAMDIITANQLKTKGVTVIESKLADKKEVIITVRGKEKYVIMDMQQYNYLRECELDAALHETRADYQIDRYVAESVEDHIKRITK